MQIANRNRIRRIRKQRDAGIAALALLLALLAGCATAPKIAPDAVKALPAEGHTVTRLNDGRQGFVIRELSSLDGETRRDFDSAVALMNDGKDAEAVVLLKGVIERAPDVTAPHINIALAYEHLATPEPAEEHLKTALALIPGHPAASNAYGLLLRKNGRFAEAREIYEKGLRNFPEFLPLRKNLGILCDLYLDDPASALEEYEIYGEALPDDEQVKVWVAALRLRLDLQ